MAARRDGLTGYARKSFIDIRCCLPDCWGMKHKAYARAGDPVLNLIARRFDRVQWNHDLDADERKLDRKSVV